MGKITLKVNGKAKSSYDTKTKTLTRYSKPNRQKKSKKLNMKVQDISKIYPLRKFVNMDYSSSLSLTNPGTAGQFGTRKLFHLNDINSPKFAQATGDPLPIGYDSLLPRYVNFKVHSADIEIELAPNTSTTNQYLCIYLLNSVRNYDITGKTLDDLNGKDMLWTYPLPFDKKFVFRKRIRIHNIEGVNKVMIDADNAESREYTGIYSPVVANLGANRPKALSSIAMSIMNPQSGVVGGISGEIKIRYHVELFNRGNLPTNVTP